MANASPQQIPQGSFLTHLSQVTIFQPLVPDCFSGSDHEDVYDWLDYFERVAKINPGRNRKSFLVPISTFDDVARTWYENREANLSTWSDFRQQFVDTFANVDRWDRAQQLLELRVQKPNKTVAMFAEEMTCLFYRANPHMMEDKKLSYLVHGVKEQLFAGLLRNPPRTVVDFIKEATAIEQALP